MKKLLLVLTLLIIGFTNDTLRSQSYSQSLIGIWDKVSGPGDPIRYNFQLDSRVFIYSQTRIDTAYYTTFSIPSSDLRGIDLGRGGVVSWRGIYKMSSDSLVLQIEGYWYTGLPPAPTPTSFSTPTTYAKVTTTKDIFPLSVGYTWRYNFTYVLTFSDVHKRTTDAGKLVLEVTGMISTPDSVRWQFTQWRDFVESYYDDPSIKNIKDTTSFELVEMMKDQHQLYAPNYNSVGIFPFKKTTIDSAKIYRYTTQNEVYKRKIYLFDKLGYYQNERDSHDITFCADTGVVRSAAVYSSLNTYSSANFNLQAFHTFYSAVHLKPGLPTEYLLSQNYPNPFNPATTIVFSIPRNSFVNLEVFNMLGQKIKTLINEEKLPGNYQVKFDCRNLASGIYFYRMQSGSFLQTKKLVLMK